MIQLFMKRSGSPVIVPLNLPASHDAMTEAASQLDEASRAGKTEIVEIKSVIANLPSYLGGLDPDSRTQLAQLNQHSSIIAKMDSRKRNIYAGALDGNGINDLNDVIRVAERVSDYILIPNVNSDVTLGRYVAVAGQIQGDPRFPEAAWPYLDFAKIGAEYYAEHGGAYTHAGYVLRKQDDELVREKKSKIQLDLSSSQAQVSICLPATKEELERVKRTLGIDCFVEAAVTKVSFSVPYMDEHIPTTGVCVEDANELAWAIEGMQCEDGELLKYLSVLSVEQPETMQDALRYAMNLDDYERIPEDTYEYGQAVLRRIGADDELIDTIAGERKIVPYLDIPIQHCNDGILKAMNRRDTKESIRKVFRDLRERIPGLVLRTSIIAGLPGEGEKEFEELCDFLHEEKIERAGVFPFSPEEGTKAAKMEHVPMEEAQRRTELLVDVQSRIIDEYNESVLGDVREVLCEGWSEEAQSFVGRSYAESVDIDGKIYFTSYREIMAGEFVNVRLTGTMDGELTGEAFE